MQPMQNVNGRKYYLDTIYPGRAHLTNSQFFAGVECKEYAIFKDCNVQDVVCNSFLELERSLAHKLTTTGYIKASACNVVGNIKSGGLVSLVHCDTRSIDSSKGVSVAASKVRGYIYSKEDIALEDVEVNEISAKHNLKLQRAQIFGRAEAGKNISLCEEVTVLGWLICCNADLNLNKTQATILVVRPDPSKTIQIVSLRDSHVKKIIFERPGGYVYLYGNTSVQTIERGKSIIVNV